MPFDADERPDTVPGPGEVLVRVEARAVRRTDLSVVEGDLAMEKPPVVPRHEIVGLVVTSGSDVDGTAPGTGVGSAWLGDTCVRCAYCQTGRENLREAPGFTDCMSDGGFAAHMMAEAAC